VVPGQKQAQKPRRRTEFHVRLEASDAEAADQIVEEKGFRSRNELIAWLVRSYLKQKEDLQEQMFAMIDRLEEHLSRRLQRIDTICQLNVAQTDALIRWIVTAMPDLPHDDAALKRSKLRGFEHYKRIQIVAAKEFRNRRATDVYRPENWLGEEEGQSDENAEERDG
jgi:hypothetical protein